MEFIVFVWLGGIVATLLLSAVGVVVLWRQLRSLQQRVAQLEQRQPSPPASEVAEPTLEVTAQLDSWLQEERVSTNQIGESRAASALQQLISGWLQALSEINLVVRIGLVVLFFGIAFLLKFAADQQLLSPAVRLGGAIVVALVVFTIGWRLRQRRFSYAMLLQGGGIGMLYISLFAAAHFYHLLPLNGVLAAMIVLALLTATLAVVQNGRALALFGVCGGFLAPLLTSDGSGNYLLLFGYYTLLNAIIFVIAWYRPWRILNLVGFGATLLVALLWGEHHYHSGLFIPIELFLGLFWLGYIAIAILYSLRQPLQLKGVVDGSIVFGVPLSLIALQAAVVSHLPNGMAVTALVMALTYLGLSYLLWSRALARGGVLAEAFVALGIGFATLAVPLWLDDRLTVVTWAVEGAALVWVGLRQGQRLSRLAGLVLQLFSAVLLLDQWQMFRTEQPLLNAGWMGGVLLGLAALFSHYRLQQRQQQLSSPERWLLPLLLLWGVGWWFLAAFDTFAYYFGSHTEVMVMLLWLWLSLLLLEQLQRLLCWPELIKVGVWALPLASLLLLELLTDSWRAPLDGWGALLWPLLLLQLYRWVNRGGVVALWPLSWLHWWQLGLFWLTAGLLVSSVSRQLQLFDLAPIWSMVASGVVVIALVVPLLRYYRQLGWPWAGYGRWLHRYGMMPVLVALLWWQWQALADSGVVGGYYLPLLNPLELTQLAVVAVWVVWWRQLPAAILCRQRYRVQKSQLQRVGLSVLFLLLHAPLARSVSHFAGIDYRLESLFESSLWQAVLALFWVLGALVAMSWGSRRGERALWRAGALLLGAVVIKLFSVDLAGSATLEQIIAFLGVGVVMLVIGYLAPQPSK